MTMISSVRTVFRGIVCQALLTRCEWFITRRKRVLTCLTKAPSPISPSTSPDFPPLSFSPLSPSQTLSSFQTEPTLVFPTIDIDHAGLDWSTEIDSSGTSGWEEEYDSDVEHDAGVWDRRPMANNSKAPTGVPVWKGGRKKLGRRVV
jgi:hypothetical protein